MKTKIAVFLVLLAAMGGSLFAQGQNVKGTYGSGPPQASNVPGDIGSLYTDTAANVMYVCTAIARTNTSTTCTWTASGSSSSGATAAGPIMGFYLTNNCQSSNIGNCFQTPADTQQANDCNYTSGSPTVTCLAAHFASTDVGKRIYGYSTCAGFLNIATSANLPISSSVALTIQTFNSTTSVTMSGNSLSTNGGGANTACVIWGHPDDAGAVLMDAAMVPATSCPKGFFAASNYMFTAPHFVTNPTACKNLGSTFPFAGNAGNMLYAAGFEMEGRSTGGTNLYLAPDFGGACTNGNSGHACWVVTTEGRWRDIMINGGGNFNAVNIPANANLVEVDGPASLDNFTCIYFASQNNGGSTAIGLAVYLWAQLYQVNTSSCGSTQLATNTSSAITAVKLSIDNPAGALGISIGSLVDYVSQDPFGFDKYNFICYDCRLFAGQGMPTALTLLASQAGRRIKLYHSTLTSYNATSKNYTLNAYNCAGANCVLDVQDTFMDMTADGIATGTGYSALTCSSQCTIKAENSIFKGTTGGFSYISTNASSQFVDLGGNTFGGPVSVLGTVVGPTNSARSTACATGNFALTSGWGTSAVASVAANGDIQGCHVSITGAAGGAGPVLTWTYPVAPPLVAPGSCHLSGVSGTLTGVSSGTPGATTVAFTFTGTPSAQAYVFDVGCP